MASPKTVMIVDDSRLARMTTQRVVNQALSECEVVSAASGEAALAALDEMAGEPDLALLDLNMPGMDGLELAEAMRGRIENTHIVICTANIQDRVRARVDDAGITFIEKPLTEAKLTSLVLERD